jgi:ankyrin repeat protein
MPSDSRETAKRLRLTAACALIVMAWAAHWNDLATAGRLIAAGADVNDANELGATPLWLACENGTAPPSSSLTTIRPLSA